MPPPWKRRPESNEQSSLVEREREPKQKPRGVRKGDDNEVDRHDSGGEGTTKALRRRNPLGRTMVDPWWRRPSGR
ncbi:hypothetical protein E2562_015016 [Oryza meyeriana var. granulata]|uniref:Uncharacterized protein n=1 Tax=Oryza meyeriana var. granulata TaxID=110450 RepID=A0A6G1EK19_9ORYZ|nr:hypothetical protein E2562_015016 [Oryza meyeriana var. granulata]